MDEEYNINQSVGQVVQLWRDGNERDDVKEVSTYPKIPAKSSRYHIRQWLTRHLGIEYMWKHCLLDVDDAILIKTTKMNFQNMVKISVADSFCRLNYWRVGHWNKDTIKIRRVLLVRNQLSGCIIVRSAEAVSGGYACESFSQIHPAINHRFHLHCDHSRFYNSG